MGTQSGPLLLFIGDSVTDCGRLQPVGRGSRGALGEGYVALVDRKLDGPRPSARPSIINMGTSGHTVRDLAARWDADVLALRPDFLSIMIGINDVWRQFDAVDRSASVMPEEFERTYEDLVGRTVARLKRLVLMTPFYVQADLSDPMRRRMDEYRAIVVALAGRHGLALGDTQAAFDAQLKHVDYRALAQDRVHPTPAGHALLADVFLRASGLL